MRFCITAEASRPGCVMKREKCIIPAAIYRKASAHTGSTVRRKKKKNTGSSWSTGTDLVPMALTLWEHGVFMVKERMEPPRCNQSSLSDLWTLQDKSPLWQLEWPWLMSSISVWRASTRRGCLTNMAAADDSDPGQALVPRCGTPHPQN